MTLNVTMCIATIDEMKLTSIMKISPSTPSILQIKNTLFVFSASIKKENLLRIDRNQVFNLVAPFLTEIGKDCFYAWYTLRHVYIPQVKVLRQGVFKQCFALKTVVASFEEVREDAFYFCSSLASVDLREVKIFAKNSFFSCSSLQFVENQRATQL